MAKVFTVVNGYAPDDARVIFGAMSAVRLGHEVFLLGAARNSQRVVPSRQNIEGVNVVIVPVARNWREGIRAVWRIMFGKMDEEVQADARHQTNLISMIIFNLWLIRFGLGRSIDIVHCHDPSPLPGAWILARLKRAGFIYDAHEDAPTFYTGRKGKCIAALERFFVKRADVVITVGERLVQALQSRGARCVVHIGNWKCLQDYAIPPETIAQTRAHHGIPDDAVVISYIGTLDPSRELRPLLAALETRPDIHLVIAGRGLLMDEVIQAAKSCPNIHWLGWLPLADIPRYTVCSTAVYCCLEKQEYQAKNYYLTPNKLFEAYAAGVPLIAVRDNSELHHLLEQSGAGILLDEVSVEALHEVFDRLKQPDLLLPLRENAKQAGQKYNWSVAEERLSQVYARLARQLPPKGFAPMSSG